MTAKKAKARRRKGRSLSIWIDPALRVKVEQLAERERRSPSSIARIAIESYVAAQLAPAAVAG
jgi:predicted transcriptional regulator